MIHINVFQLISSIYYLYVIKLLSHLGAGIMVLKNKCKSYKVSCLNCGWENNLLIKKKIPFIRSRHRNIPKQCPKCKGKLMKQKIHICF